MPGHTGLEEGLTEIMTGGLVLTVIVTVLDVAALPVAQSAFDVRMQLTRSPFDGV